ncbi:hypothetical protein GCM10011503_29310 [Henriciella pelagia]|uniref:Uncharacterized protein n=1 Tax=Henriciella pelagia TaxID=1977912 RepID=A0ABQ1JZ33_9PROT|nr:hypothetical protein GCM10011503_29310 [Henriciella pelagia]
MVELVMSVANNTATAWWVLAGAALIITVEAARSSKHILWGDIGEDDHDD